MKTAVLAPTAVLMLLTSPLAAALPQLDVPALSAKARVVVGNKMGKPISESDLSAAVDIAFDVDRQKPGVVTIGYRLVSLREEAQFYKLACSLDIPGQDLACFDGQTVLPVASLSQGEVHAIQMLAGGVFPMAALWSGSAGIALGAGAEDHHSFLRLTVGPTGAGASATMEVNVALLKKGSVYEGKFHLIDFDAKYQERDALARYYQLYPHRFQRNPAVDPRIYGVCAEYSSWAGSDPEACRLAGADWEWCLRYCRLIGDIDDSHFTADDTPFDLPRYQYRDRAGKWHEFGREAIRTMPKEEFEKHRNYRQENAYYCSVAHALYNGGLSRVEAGLAKLFPDSLATTHPRMIEYKDPSIVPIFTFPETSWGAEIRRMTQAVAQRDDIHAMAFDIPLESEVYRGVALDKMSNVSWDEYGAGVVRTVGSSKYLDFIHTVPQKYGKYKLGVVTNSNIMHQINECFFADTIMIEANPWQLAPPWPQGHRYAMGEKGVTFWEGYALEEFDPNWRKLPANILDGLVHGLSLYAAHRSFLYGITYPAYYNSDYLRKLLPAMKACNNAGWKAVPGMKTDAPELTLTRYGSGDRSLIAVCNLKKKLQPAAIEVFPGEFWNDVVGSGDGRPLVFADFYGHLAVNVYRDGRTFAETEVPPLRLRVLECVGSVASGARGKITAQWESTFDRAVLSLASDGWAGEVKVRDAFGPYELDGSPTVTLPEGGKVHVTYRNRLTVVTAEQIAGMKLLDEQHQPLFRILHADDPWSRFMAERMACFFQQYGKSVRDDFAWKPDIRPDRRLKPFSVCLATDDKAVEALAASAKVPGIAGSPEPGILLVTGTDRDSLRELTSLLCNALNRIKYPEYLGASRTTKPMAPEDQALFKCWRLAY